MTVITRAEWGADPAAAAAPLDPARVVGIAVHWPAMREPLRGVAAVSAALRGWQDYHMGKGWRDIAYQVAADQAGNRYILRGLAGQSAANGDEDVNERYGAVLAVLAPGEQPTPAMLRELRAVVEDHRGLFPASRQVVGHNDIRPEPTACPGPILQGLIDDGSLEPDLEDDMTPEEFLAHRIEVKRDGKPVKLSIEQVLRETFQRAERVDEDAIAAAVIGRLPDLSVTGGTITAAQIRDAVKVALREGTG